MRSTIHNLGVTRTVQVGKKGLQGLVTIPAGAAGDWFETYLHRKVQHA